MTRPQMSYALGLLFLILPAHAKERRLPCHTRSRELTMLKNCYTGDMMKPIDGGAQFFQTSETDATGAAYCYNSLVMVEQKAGEALIQIHVLRDGKDGNARAYNYVLAPEELKKSKKDAPMISLKGLKGECYSPSGNLEACNGGFLKAIGLKDVDVPLVMAVGKAGTGQYTVSHLVSKRSEVKGHHVTELEMTGDQDADKMSYKVLQEIRHKLTFAARAKMASVQSGKTTPQVLSETSEQFRFCSLALESFLKEKRLQDPFSPEEKMTLAKLTSYMNGEPAPADVRTPASSQKK